MLTLIEGSSTLPRYLFHVFDDDETLDDEGTILPDLDAARGEAVKGARSIMADELRTRGQSKLSDWVKIEDENGEMTVVTFGDAVIVQP